MRQSIAALLVAVTLCTGCATDRVAGPALTNTLSLIPVPAQIERLPGSFRVDTATVVVADRDDREVTRIAQAFADRLESARGLRLAVTSSTAPSEAARAIIFTLASDSGNPMGTEAYRITVDARQIRVSASSAHGLFNGSVTLWQLLTQTVGRSDSIAVPALRIVDAPRFAWRGAMLDSSRHFQSPEFIKRFIDQLALAKLNTFHWHLTDDQGWRIEIRKYPRLTDVGAWRQPAGAAGIDVDGQPVRYGGFYSQDEIRDIVRYAAERYVTIVPEIDMPGHMQAAIAAYPQLGSAGDTPVVSPDWGVHSYLLNVDESTFAFISDVLDEVVALFPGRYIHIGGDEAVKDQWKASPRVQARMHELGLADETALQGWFVARLQKMLDAHARKLIGWDEILEGELSTDATVMSWRGVNGGIEAAHKGHDVVMAPSPDLYLDHLQGDGADEPSGRPDLRTLADIYAFQPTPEGMDEAAASHVFGAQANLWAEHMRTSDLVEHAAFPRLAALAEVLWSPPSSHDWNDFIARLVPQMDRYAQAGIAAAQSAFEVRFEETFNTDASRVSVSLSSQVALPIHYSVDGSEPALASPIYQSPLDLPVPVTLRAATFLGARHAGKVDTRELSRSTRLARSNHELKQCAGKLVLRLQDDAPASGDRAYFDVDLFDPCWLFAQAPLDGISAIRIGVGQLPYNFQLSTDAASIVPRAAAKSAAGDLLVHVDGCAGPLIASLPLATAFENPRITALEAQLPSRSGNHDLCFVFAGKTNDPLWVIDSVQLIPAD